MSNVIRWANGILPDKTTFSVLGIIASQENDGVTAIYQDTSIMIPKDWFSKMDQKHLDKGRVIVIERKNRRYAARIAKPKEVTYFQQKTDRS